MNNGKLLAIRFYLFKIKIFIQKTINFSIVVLF